MSGDCTCRVLCMHCVYPNEIVCVLTSRMSSNVRNHVVLFQLITAYQRDLRDGAVAKVLRHAG